MDMWLPGRNSIRTPALTACLLTLAVADNAFAHNENVHVQISTSAFHSSSGLSNVLVTYFGMVYSNFDIGPLLATRPTDEPGLRINSPLQWLSGGSFMEDVQDPAIKKLHFLRSSDHFYTVTPSRIVGETIDLTDDSETPGVLPIGITNSFVWGTTLEAIS